MRTVSVIIPTYNCEKYIIETIDSVLNQTYKNIEIVVVDDGSDDNTEIILYDKIKNNKIIYQKQNNKGLSAARNEGIRISSGHIIAFLDSDDIIMPEYIEKTVAHLDKHKCDVVVTDWVRFGSINDVIIEEQHRIRKIPLDNKDLFESCFYDFNGTYCTVQNKSLFDNVGYFDENLYAREDVDIWLRFAQAGCRIEVLHEPLFRYRKRQGSLTATPSYRNILSRYRFLTKYHKNIIKNNKLRKLLFTKYKQLFNDTLAYDPTDINKYIILIKTIYKMANTILYV